MFLPTGWKLYDDDDDNNNDDLVGIITFGNGIEMATYIEKHLNKTMHLDWIALYVQ